MAAVATPIHVALARVLLNLTAVASLPALLLVASTTAASVAAAAASSTAARVAAVSYTHLTLPTICSV
eukprot:5712567-Alexandrium_andersonii.AAC.1